MLKSKYIKEFPQKLLSDGSSDWWTQGSVTTEFYYNQSLDIKPLNVIQGSELIEGTLGSLAIGEWAWGDNDTLGFDVLYIRLLDDTDPDTKTNVTCSEFISLIADTKNETMVLNITLSNTENSDANIVLIISGIFGVVKNIQMLTLEEDQDPKVLKKFVMSEDENILIMCNKEKVNAQLSYNEVE